MQPHDYPTLRGCRCQCTACGQYFTCERTFDHHRYGDHAVSRHCLTVAEMEAGGWMQNRQGFWTDTPLKGAPVDLAGSRNADPLPSPSLGTRARVLQEYAHGRR
jgi:hypothetical protein